MPSERYTILIPLAPDERPAMLTAAFPLSADEWQHMIAMLDAMKPGLVRPEPDAEAAGQGAERGNDGSTTV